MAAYLVVFHFTLRDIDGISSTVSVADHGVDDATTMAQLATDSDTIGTPLQAASNAKVVQRSVTFLRDAAQGVGTDAEFPLVSQKAVFHFSNAQGSRASLSVPAPKEAMFKAPPADDIIDPAQALSAALITAVESVATDEGLNSLNLFQGGALSSHARSRRRSIHV
jgi:hypothetical protein